LFRAFGKISAGSKMKSIIILICCILSLTSLSYGSDTPKKDPLDSLRLLGTVLGSDSTESIAITREADSKILDIHKVGDSLFGYQIVRIIRGAIILLKGGKTTLLNLPLGSELEPILVMNEKERIINRLAMAKQIPDLTQAYNQVLAAPYISSGKVKGIKIGKIKDKVLLSNAGIKEGDIITRVNNEKLDNLQNALKLYANLQNEDTITLQIQRGGEIKDLVYHLN
jgi:type II secretion system protein C